MKYMGVALQQAVKTKADIKGLVLMTCGPAWTNQAHYKRLCGLVEK
jgi:hypothetical protein